MAKVNPGSIAAGEILEKFGFKIFQTAGFQCGWKATRALYTHGDKIARVNGAFTSEELRAMADYMDATK